MSLFNNLRQSERDKQLAVEAEYWALLAVVDPATASPADVERLANYMRGVGKSLEQVEADHAALNKLKAHLQTVADNADAAEQTVKADVEHLRACKERQYTWVRINDAVRLAHNALNDWRARQTAHDESRTVLTQARERLPLMYAAVVKPIEAVEPPADVTDAVGDKRTPRKGK